MKILLAIDGSKYSDVAVEQIAVRPFPLDTEVRILSAYEPIALMMGAQLAMGGDSEFYADLDAAERQSAEDAVNEAAKIITEKNSTLSVSSVVVSGSPKDTILEEAVKFGADLIVVGSQGRGAISRFLLGSVSQSVALHAPCSVEIVREKDEKKAT